MIASEQLSLLKTFIVGGALLATTQYVGNNVNNPALAAIIGFLPISIMVGILIRGHENKLQYFNSSFRVCVGTMVSYVVALFLFRMSWFQDNATIVIATLIWGVVQTANYMLG